MIGGRLKERGPINNFLPWKKGGLIEAVYGMLEKYVASFPLFVPYIFPRKKSSEQM